MGVFVSGAQCPQECTREKGWDRGFSLFQYKLFKVIPSKKKL